MNAYGEHYTRYQLQRNTLRKIVRKFYLRSARSRLHGPTVDLGCGIGDLLHGLPPGSIGLDINESSVAHCAARGLTALDYDGESDDWSLTPLDASQRLQSLVVSHVLEHLDDPMAKLRKLLLASKRLGITTVLIVVPGRRGYASDATHRTFVDLDMLASPDHVQETGFRLHRSRYFPGNFRWLGDRFTHHELQVAFRRQS